jgi:hypothetical protein
MRRRRGDVTRWAVVAATSVLVLARPLPAIAGDRFALLVTGASGGQEYALRYDVWRDGLA